MKIIKCIGCGADIKVEDDYNPEYCCNEKNCGCMGKPTNPALCDFCEEKLFYENKL